MKPALPNSETSLQEPDGVRSAETFSAAGNSEETGVSFDHPMQVDTLHSVNKVISVPRYEGTYNVPNWY